MPIYQLRANKQPPAQTVYQRILKPHPTVILLGPETNGHDFFVEASLIRADTNTELPMCLEGMRMIQIIPGQFSIFKRLKILSTTQQQGTLFKLKFQLKKFQNDCFVTVPGISALSNPIEVYSHTSYINKGKNTDVSTVPPVVKEILPSRGSARGVTRVVILGSNFSNSQKLSVMLGDTVVQPTFHESGTLICTTQPGVPGSVLSVRVSNDGVDYCPSSAIFTYDYDDNTTT